MFTFILHLLTVWVFNPYSIYYEKLVQKYFFKNDYNFLKSGVYFLVMSVFFKPQNRTILPFHSHPINSRPHSIDQLPLLTCPWMPAVSQKKKKKKKRNVKKNFVAIIMIIIDLYGLLYNEISTCKKFMTHRGIFVTQSNIYDGGFLEKSLCDMKFSRLCVWHQKSAKLKLPRKILF